MNKSNSTTKRGPGGPSEPAKKGNDKKRQRMNNGDANGKGVAPEGDELIVGNKRTIESLTSDVAKLVITETQPRLEKIVDDKMDNKMHQWTQRERLNSLGQPGLSMPPCTQCEKHLREMTAMVDHMGQATQMSSWIRAQDAIKEAVRPVAIQANQLQKEFVAAARVRKGMVEDLKATRACLDKLKDELKGEGKAARSEAEALKAEIDALKGEIDALKAEIYALKAGSGRG
ncbi:hypothetical protein QBC47DRAFT_462860 [Echria macrotheca]|uniref:Uncharacterized protein n=1 Tax=Echria macrotheca TaxID=438768 RepID=A0AAJ0F4C0_9PEZI|nr:hypothetical protein QBC47DRAFT_462860 [Echria macrotheca]